MTKTASKTSLATKIIFLFCIASVLFLFLTPIIFFDYGTSYGIGIKAIWGYQAILGIGSREIYASDGSLFRSMTFDFNWQIYITCLLFILIGFTTYFIGPRAKGYYIFSAILLAVCAIICFASKSWFVNATIHIGLGSGIGDSARAHLGVGPWASGFLACFGAVACIFEYKTFKLR